MAKEQAEDASVAPIKPWSSLAFRDYRLLWSSSLLGMLGLQMRQFANVFQVYELSGSALQLGLTGLFQAIPLFAIGLFAGTLADAVDRKKLLIATQSANVALALAMFALTLSGQIQVWHIYVITSLTASVNIFTQPARMSLIPSMVPRSHMLNAVTLNQVINQAGMFIGPGLAGVVVASRGVSSAYLVNAILFAPGILALASIRGVRQTEAQERERRTVRFSDSLKGLNFVWSTPILVGLILLDTVATLFGSYRAVMPIFAKDILEVGPRGLGALLAAPALGALLGTVTILAVGNFRKKGLVVLFSTFLYGCSLVVFGFSHWFALSLVVAGCLGMLDSIGVSARQTTVQLLAPDRMRGRTTSISQIFAMGAPSMGYVLAGVVAAMAGAPLTMVLGGVVVCAVVIGIAFVLRQVREYQA